MENGKWIKKWKMENGKRKMENGKLIEKWKMENGSKNGNCYAKAPISKGVVSPIVRKVSDDDDEMATGDGGLMYTPD